MLKILIMIKRILKIKGVEELNKQSMKTLQGGNLNDNTQEMCEQAGGSWEYNFGSYHCVYEEVDHSDHTKQ